MARTREESAKAYAEQLVRAVEVTVGEVKGWQVQTRDAHFLAWSSTNVMCDEETAKAEVETRRAEVIEDLKE